MFAGYQKAFTFYQGVITRLCLLLEHEGSLPWAAGDVERPSSLLYKHVVQERYTAAAYKIFVELYSPAGVL